MHQEVSREGIEAEPQPQPDWQAELPKTKEEALAEVQAAKTAYHALQLPPSWYPNTPEVTLADLYKSRAAVDNYVPRSYPDLSRTKVPRGLEEWALRKIALARNVRRAKHSLDLFITRILKESNEDSYKWPDEEDEEIYKVGTGHFEIRVSGNKPKLVFNDFASVAKEIHERLEQCHREWMERHKSGLLSRFPRISRFLEFLSSARKAGIKFRTAEDVYWFTVDRMAALYLLDHPTDKSQEKHD